MFAEDFTIYLLMITGACVPIVTAWEVGPELFEPILTLAAVLLT